jgi:hypothetical protein
MLPAASQGRESDPTTQPGDSQDAQERIEHTISHHNVWKIGANQKRTRRKQKRRYNEKTSYTRTVEEPSSAGHQLTPLKGGK